MSNTSKMSRALTIKRHDLERFVAGSQEKAVDYLLRYCHSEPEIEKEILRILLDEPANTPSVPIVDSTRGSVAAKISPTTKRAGSFSDHRRQSSRGNVRPNAESTPPPSRSSVSGGEGLKTILILSPTEDEDIDIKKVFASMKPAPIKYSVISEHMFHEGRIPENNIEELDDLRISIPQRGFPGTLVSFTVTRCAELTWRSTGSTRSSSKASHCTLFYLVPQELLDIDVLLGSLDSGEGLGLNLREDESYHRSENADRIQSHELVHDFLRKQQQQTSTIPHPAAVAKPKQPSGVSRASQSTAIDAEYSKPAAGQSAEFEKLKIKCKLNGTTFSIRIDPAHPQAFIDTIHREFKKRKVSFRQSDTAIWIKSEKEALDEDGYYMSLHEDDLKENWTECLQWLSTNKQADSDVMHGVFQIDVD